METKVKSVRALERGLAVLDVVQKAGPLSLADLHRRTSLSRATILRALKTLVEQGWVDHDAARGAYRPAGKLLGPAMRRREKLVAELAAPILVELARKAPYPADVAVRRGNHMVIVQSSRRRSNFPINMRAEGRQPCMLRSALGRAYLAFCPPEEREEILRLLRETGHPDDRPANAEKWVARLLEESRRQGYGVREAGYWSTPEDYSADVNSIAAPVFLGEKVAACVNLMWVVGTNSVEEFARSHLDDLRTAAAALSKAIAASPVPSP